MNKHERPTVVIGGYLGLLEGGGIVWDYIQYPLGFRGLGCEVYYIEDTGLWPLFEEHSGDTPDCSANVDRLARIMAEFGLADRWAYRDAVSGEDFGPMANSIRRICAKADVFVNISCSTLMRDEYQAIPVRALIDSDPMFTQIQYTTGIALTGGESQMRRLVGEHTHHFTFGENIGADDCRIPSCGVSWLPTRQPVCLSLWPPSQPNPDATLGYSTVMNWSAAEPVEYDGETWGQKNSEFSRMRLLPSRVDGLPLSVAVSRRVGSPFPTAEFEASGWHVLEPREFVPDWKSYRDFIARSRGEFSVAKHTYVKARTGWFSCRSACYLASGRPVIAQDTGWSRYIPPGEGLLAFDTSKQAVDALLRVDCDLVRHGVAARAIAEQYFDSRVVLGEMLDSLGM